MFTGTVPDYAADAKGLLLGGVIGGGPAEQAGLQKGDVIIEIAGQTIANIYDYTYALELLKIGEPVKVVYMRGSERRETTLTPAASRQFRSNPTERRNLEPERTARLFRQVAVDLGDEFLIGREHLLCFVREGVSILDPTSPCIRA